MKDLFSFDMTEDRGVMSVTERIDCCQGEYLVKGRNECFCVTRLSVQERGTCLD